MCGVESTENRKSTKIDAYLFTPIANVLILYKLVKGDRETPELYLTSWLSFDQQEDTFLELAFLNVGPT